MRFRLPTRTERRRLIDAAAVVIALGALLALGVLNGARAAEPAKPTHEIRDPHYGDTLFHFFQVQLHLYQFETADTPVIRTFQHFDF